MDIAINREMALDLVRYYMRKLHETERIQPLTTKQLETWIIARDNLTSLVLQLKLNGEDIDALLESVRKELNIQYSYKQVLVRVDGAARGNDNPDVDNLSGIAFSVYGDGVKLHSEAECIGSFVDIVKEDTGEVSKVSATNNVAEYLALIKGLQFLLNNNINAPDVLFLSDSNVVVQQVNFTNATRAPHLISLRNQALRLIAMFPNFRIEHVSREENHEVDALVNIILDQAETT